MNTSKFSLFLTTLFLWVSGVVSCSAANNGDSHKQKTDRPVCNDWIHPDEVAYQSLGRRLTDVLINAKTVKVYSLTPKEKANPDDFVVESPFVRDSLLGTLTKEQHTVLCYNLISNGANYSNDTSLIVMSPYYPIIEFEFIKKKEIAHVIISLSDFSWSLKYDDKVQFHFNYANGSFVRRFCSFFLKEEKTNN